MLDVLGFDIGGANTKAAFVRSETGFLKEIRTISEYFPFWKNPDGLGALLSELAGAFCDMGSIGAVGVTMTAELSDAFSTKREGVNRILAEVFRAFPGKAVYVLDVNGGLRSLQEAGLEPLKVAAANWMATGWLVSHMIDNCVVVDTGSTSTSIIPILGGDVSAAGRTDLEKLINGELVYTGGLRTNVAAIVNSVPIGAGVARVSSELFASSGDVHLILGNIRSEEFTTETADGREKTREASLGRLARVVCADIETLSEKEIIGIAQFVYDRQTAQIADGLIQVWNRVKSYSDVEFAAVVTGFGKKFLARKAAEKAGFHRIIDFDELVAGGVSNVSTAVGLAFMVASKLEGSVIQWMR